MFADYFRVNSKHIKVQKNHYFNHTIQNRRQFQCKLHFQTKLEGQIKVQLHVHTKLYGSKERVEKTATFIVQTALSV